MALSNIVSPAGENFTMLGVSTTHSGALSNIVKQAETVGDSEQLLNIRVTHTGALGAIVNSTEQAAPEQILRLVLIAGGGGVTDVGYIG
jgi:hypothetical protein